MKRREIHPGDMVCAEGTNFWVGAGYLMRWKLRCRKLIYWGSLSVITLLILISFSSELKRIRQEAETSETLPRERSALQEKGLAERDIWAVNPSPWDGEVKMVTQYLKDVVRDPRSLKFNHWENSVLKDVLITTVDFTSTNGFGGPAREKWTFKIDRKEGEFLEIYNTRGELIYSRPEKSDIKDIAGSKKDITADTPEPQKEVNLDTVEKEWAWAFVQKKTPEAQLVSVSAKNEFGEDCLYLRFQANNQDLEWRFKFSPEKKIKEVYSHKSGTIELD